MSSTPLLDHPPVRCLQGGSRILSDFGRKIRQPLVHVLADDCHRWAGETRDVLDGIAATATATAARLELYTSDGVISPTERERLLSDLRAITAAALMAISRTATVALFAIGLGAAAAGALSGHLPERSLLRRGPVARQVRLVREADFFA